jgi:hypothetical protein
MTNEPAEVVSTYTGFKRNLLYAIAALGGTPDTDVEKRPYGLGIKRKVESWYGEQINHGRLYPNLDQLADDGFVSVADHDRRTNAYALTDAGVDAIVAYHTTVIGPALQEAGVFEDVIPPEIVDSGVLA